MTYPGGKHGSGVYQQIINLIPPHDRYIEPFLGGGAIMKMKRPAAASIGIDIDPTFIKDRQDLNTPNLTLLNRDALEWLTWADFKHTDFIYLDPPYLFYTRSSQRMMYTHECDDNDHWTLLNLIKEFPCMVMISGYPNDLYDDALSSWWTATFRGQTRGRAPATEKIWMNYPPPILLHDYSYLGSNFREREKLKRKRLRWIARLGKMLPLERNCLAASIAAFIETGQHRQEERTAPAQQQRSLPKPADPPRDEPATEKEKVSEPPQNVSGLREN